MMLGSQGDRPGFPGPDALYVGALIKEMNMTRNDPRRRPTGPSRPGGGYGSGRGGSSGGRFEDSGDSSDRSGGDSGGSQAPSSGDTGGGGGSSPSFD